MGWGREKGGLDEEEQASWLDVTGAMSSSSVAQSVPNENLYGMTLAADLHGLEEATGQSNVGGLRRIYAHTQNHMNIHR